MAMAITIFAHENLTKHKRIANTSHISNVVLDRTIFRSLNSTGLRYDTFGYGIGVTKAMPSYLRLLALRL